MVSLHYRVRLNQLSLQHLDQTVLFYLFLPSLAEGDAVTLRTADSQEDGAFTFRHSSVSRYDICG